jgi:dienelactone hydrolase
MLFPQKPPINIDAYNNWETLGDVRLCGNGNYVLYAINNQKGNGHAVVLSSTVSDWQLTFPGSLIKGSCFTKDSHKAIVKIPGDSLAVFTLGTSTVEYIPFVKDFRPNKEIVGDWIVYLTSGPNNMLVVHNLRTGANKLFNNVVNYLINYQGSHVIFKTQTKGAPVVMQHLICFSIFDNNVDTIWEGVECNNITFDSNGKQVAFISTGNNNENHAIFYYKMGLQKAIKLIEDSSSNALQGFSISDEELTFNREGKGVFFSLQKKKPAPVKLGYSGVSIWNYKDIYLQSQQNVMASNGYLTKLKATIRLEHRELFVLHNDNEQLASLNTKNTANYVLIYSTPLPDSYFKREGRSNLVLESTVDGSRKLIISGVDLSQNELSLSPCERFVIYFNSDSLSYFSYEISTGISRNISKLVPSLLYDDEAARIGRFRGFGIGGWLALDKFCLLYDKFDVWIVDPTGVKPSRNITQGVGRETHTVFGIINSDRTGSSNSSNVNVDLLLSGFNRDNKENGFWVLDHRLKLKPDKRVMDAYSYWIERTGSFGYVEYASAGLPIEAENKSIYIVKRMSAAESPNLFSTKDFRSFRQISYINPEKRYNWLNNELIRWKMTDGRMSQGILYKPENFDPMKKYPLIFDYYEKRSDGLNEYIKPDFSYHRINIPSYVSNGYLVFVPDIYYFPGQNGKGVVNSVVSAAQYLSKFPWVDSTKMGLMGHSFGGWETNYLITHSNLFAAACEAAGVSDQVSAYGQLGFESGGVRQGFYEVGSQGSPFGVGVTPWTRSDLYIQNSPIFNIGNVTTPLLMMHCKRDPAVPFEQAIELFTGLKRAGKKVWLLQYDNGDHFVSGEDAKDYTTRMRQFFDHYLKGLPAPIWMARGVPADKKGIETGLELDTSYQKP